MIDAGTIEYLGYNIAVTELAGRFTPRVSRAGGVIEHDGRVSEIWAAASCGSMDRALAVAKSAIDTGRIKRGTASQAEAEGRTMESFAVSLALREKKAIEERLAILDVEQKTSWRDREIDGLRCELLEVDGMVARHRAAAPCGH